MRKPYNQTSSFEYKRERQSSKDAEKELRPIMTMTPTEQTTAITLTETAATEIKNLFESQGVENAALRVFVSGGGCSGLQYGMAFDDEVRDGDEVVEQSGVKIIVDDFSAPHVRGSEIDYVDGLMGAGFTLQNPNYAQPAAGGCGCGGNCACGGHH